MPDLNAKVTDFLAQKRIAVAGVSRTRTNDAANFIFRKLRQAGYRVFPVNPNAKIVEGETCFPDLKAIPEAVDAVVIVTRPEVSEQLVEQCAERGISRVWLHRSFGKGSVSKAATEFCEAHNITVIAGACPMMYCPPVDFGHKCMRGLLRLTGGLPK